MKIALYAGSFNPPGLHHWRIIKILEEIFDKILIIPCGQCPDKEKIIEINHRIKMIHLAFTETNKIKFDFKDAINGTFLRPYELEKEYNHIGESWYIVGSDIILGGANKNSSVHKNWKNGYYLWEKLNFAIVTRPGYSLSKKDLPLKYTIIKTNIVGSSSNIRNLISLNKDLTALVQPNLIKYIKKYKLYKHL